MRRVYALCVCEPLLVTELNAEHIVVCEALLLVQLVSRNRLPDTLLRVFLEVDRVD